ncbi:MAG: phosphoglycerate kinase [Candidatus Colwellbacteria bacterium]|nr:phosphoglycerate kinase [Candidatus Colwellbacteria bacterium]MBI3274180.1 phosphoglycerate kinase [Candidatus Colwellbacteria bacterium]
MITYLLRTNLDIEDKKPQNSLRLRSAASTIKLLSKKNNKLVILSHFGRPVGNDPDFSLKRFKKSLEGKIKKRIVFIPGHNFSNIKRIILKAPLGTLFLLENLRFLKGETKNDYKLSKSLADLGNRYVNDDFATSHRSNASNVGITKFLPSVPGPTIKNEIRNLKQILENPRKPLVLILGGIKMADKIGVIDNLLSKTDYVLLGGGSANTVLKARGVNVGKSAFDAKVVKSIGRLCKNKKIITPIDFKKSGGKILDMGHKTLAGYTAIIKSARTVIWGGPLGQFENREFSSGSYGVARAIAKSRAFSIVGGGETVEIITHLGLEKKISFLSTGGGAMLDYLAGLKLPALVALKLQRK